MEVDVGIQMLAAERVDECREALRDIAVVKCLRTIAAFFDSAWALSLLWRERDLVCSSMSSLLSNLATW